MMGEMALSLSSSLGSRRWGKRLVSSATLLSGDDAGMMLSEVSSSSLSILENGNAPCNPGSLGEEESCGLQKKIKNKEKKK